MGEEVMRSTRTQCPACGSGNIKRSRRSRREKTDYPDNKFYRCRKCSTRFMVVREVEPPPEPEAPDSAPVDAPPPPPTPAPTPAPPPTPLWEDDSDQFYGPLFDYRFILIFIAACALTAMLIVLFGRG